MAGNVTHNKAGAIGGTKLRAKLNLKDRLHFHSESNDRRAAGDSGSGSVPAGPRDLPTSSSQPAHSPPENASGNPVATLDSSPISELWNQAYEDLRTEDDVLVRGYEATLSKYLRAADDSTEELSSSKIKRKDQMNTILKEKVQEVNQNAWKLRFGNGNNVPLKDAIQPIIGIIESANEFIGKVASVNPYASLAWSGVSILLPLFLNPSNQAASLAKDLAYISNLIAQSSLREELYTRRYESENSDGEDNPLQESHSLYKETLKKLYVQIMKFQATSICYYSKNSAFRIGLDMVKWNTINELWKDRKYDEECEALIKRHQESMNTLNTISTDVSGLRKAVEDAQQDGTRRRLLDWLSSVDPSENYNSAQRRHEPQTAEWLVQGNESFKEWEHSPNSLIWLHGKAGSGKSVLSSSVIKYLRNCYDLDPQTVIAYFYYSFSDVAKQNLEGMLCSLIKQLCCHRPDTPQPLKALSKHKERGQRPDIETLEATLAGTTHGFSNVYLVIDALDECPFESGERKVLLNCLRRIHMAEYENLHLLCTSRNESDIAAALRPLMCSASRLPVDLSVYKAAVDHDIGLYIDGTLSSNSYESWSDDIKTETRKSLIENADGMFQYVSCQFENLLRLSSPGKVRKALKELPKGLDATYDRMLQNIDPEFQSQVANTLKWLAFSLRPLYIDELAEVFILDHSRPVPFDEGERLFKPSDVLKFLPGLVTTFTPVFDYPEVKRDDPIGVGLAHFSIKEYLISTRIVNGPAATFAINEAEAHLHIAKSCLAYQLLLSETELMTKEILCRFVLWEYVVEFWMDHLEKVARESWPDSVTNQATLALTPASTSLLNMIRNSDPDADGRNWNMKAEDLRSPLYHVISSDAFQLADLLIQGGADVNKQEGHSPKALRVAASHGNVRMVELLIDSGADIHADGGNYANALVAGVRSGVESVVQLLVDRGANIKTHGVEALCAASTCGDESMVQLLLDNGVDLNARERTGSTALFGAALIGHQPIAELLLDLGADVNVQGGRYGNPLQAAIVLGDESMVSLLLHEGADVKASGGLYGNALQAAIGVGDLETTRLLLSLGSKLDPSGPEWKKLLANVAEKEPSKCADRLRKVQENPDEYEHILQEMEEDGEHNDEHDGEEDEEEN